MRHLLISFHALLCWHDKPCFCFFAVPKSWRLKKKHLLCCDLCPAPVDQAYELVQQFTQMLRERRGMRLDTWLAQANQSNIPELRSFAAGVEKDKEAVKAGLTWWINNGVVEGQVTKLKLIKRQGYGRAGFLLLRKRVLHAL